MQLHNPVRQQDAGNYSCALHIRHAETDKLTTFQRQTDTKEVPTSSGPFLRVARGAWSGDETSDYSFPGVPRVIPWNLRSIIKRSISFVALEQKARAAKKRTRYFSQEAYTGSDTTNNDLFHFAAGHYYRMRAAP